MRMIEYPEVHRNYAYKIRNEVWLPGFLGLWVDDFVWDFFEDAFIATHEVKRSLGELMQHTLHDTVM